MSEFGRTLTTNGDGSDHAWGGNVMVMGGDILGGQVNGSYPSLGLDVNGTGQNVSGRGIFIPTTSTDQYLGALAMWFGVPQSELSSLFPSLGNVWSASSPTDTPLDLFI